MKVIYDPETDTLDIILKNEPVSQSDEVREGIIIDYSQDGKLVSIEVLDASEHVLEPNAIIYETRGLRK